MRRTLFATVLVSIAAALPGAAGAQTMTATDGFRAANGIITAPDGTQFVAKGINIFGYQTGEVSGAVTQMFPGITMIRLAVQDYSSAASLSGFVNQMTSQHIVVEIEDHSPPFGSNNVLSDAGLAKAVAWYKDIASTFKANPYVWFGTMNEPDCESNEGVVTFQQAAVYDVIRSTGNNSPIMMEQIAGYTDTKNGGLTASSYAQMKNVIWDTHVYGWESNSDTSRAAISAALIAQVANAQSIKSTDGVMPVIIGEYGISSTGYGGADPNGTQVVDTVNTSGYGRLAWAWSAGTDTLVENGSLNAFGRQVANYIKDPTIGVAGPVFSPGGQTVAPGAVQTPPTRAQGVPDWWVVPQPTDASVAKIVATVPPPPATPPNPLTAPVDTQAAPASAAAPTVQTTTPTSLQQLTQQLQQQIVAQEAINQTLQTNAAMPVPAAPAALQAEMVQAEQMMQQADSLTAQATALLQRVQAGQ